MLQRLLSWSRTPSVASAASSRPASSPADSNDESSLEREPVHLPDEIILEILTYIPEGKESQPTLRTCSLLARQWHYLSVQRLYRAPHLQGWNFDPFVRTICPSLNAHIRKSDLAGLVKVLDMSKLVHQGSKSTTARLLGRTKVSLEEFVAPQANWGVNCLAALSRCTKLRKLDMGLLSESLSYREISTTIQNLKELRSFCFPRSAQKTDSSVYTVSHMAWPPKLEDLTLSGPLVSLIRNDFHPLNGGAPNLPPKLTALTIQHTHCDADWLQTILHAVGHNLTYLKLSTLKSPNLEFEGDPLGQSQILHLCPQLETLAIDANYLRLDFILKIPVRELDVADAAFEHGLKALYVALPSQVGADEGCDLDPETLSFALAEEAFPSLRIVTYEKMFKAPNPWPDEYVELHQLLRERARSCDEDERLAGVRFAIMDP